MQVLHKRVDTYQVKGLITIIYINRVLTQLTLELDNIGSRYELWSRPELMVSRFIHWYGVNGNVEYGIQVTLDITVRLEIVGMR